MRLTLTLERHTLQGVSMGRSQSLQPTLWRTCRVLANRRRLQILRLLLQQPDQCVSHLAERVAVPAQVVSQYLRAMNARGLLRVRRVGKWVYYRPGADESVRQSHALLEGLRLSFRRERQAEENIFRLATAFTHPKRVEIFRALQGRMLTAGQLSETTGISGRAVHRHLRKLRVRGFVEAEAGIWRGIQPPAGLAKVLAQLAGE